MKKSILVLSLVIIVVGVSFAGITLNASEVDSVLFMVEEEKLARDVYLTLYDKWGLITFSNIARSEQRHVDAVKYIIEKYGLEDPTIDEIGVFKNEELQALYTQLVETGSKSLVDAIKIGLLIEELDIKDLKERIEATDNGDIITVFNLLMDGSENHFRAFYSLLQRFSTEDYTPQYITIEEMQEILSGTNERGGMGHRPF